MSSQDPMVAPTEEQPPEKKRRGGILLLVLSILLIVAGVTFGVMSFLPGHSLGHSLNPATQQLRDMDGELVVPDEPIPTSSEFTEQLQMVEDDGGDGFVVPSLNLDVPLGSINSVDNALNPPNFTSVFVVRNMGVSLDNADQGTVYMATHAIQHGHAPGDYFQKNGQVTLNPGDIIKANNRQYAFVESQVIPKKGDDGLSSHGELWTNDPGRLVLITCLLNPDGHSNANDNLVIIAKLVS